MKVALPRAESKAVNVSHFAAALSASGYFGEKKISKKLLTGRSYQNIIRQQAKENSVRNPIPANIFYASVYVHWQNSQKLNDLNLENDLK